MDLTNVAAKGTKTCPECRALVSADHDECPRCRADIANVTAKARSGRVTMFGGGPLSTPSISPLQGTKAGASSAYEPSQALEPDEREDGISFESLTSLDIGSGSKRPKKPWEKG